MENLQDKIEKLGMKLIKIENQKIHFMQKDFCTVECFCGKIFNILVKDLYSLNDISCGCKFRPIKSTKIKSGDTFGKLIAESRIGKNKGGQSIWTCKCDCSMVTSVASGILTNGHVRSCGCGCYQKMNNSPLWGGYGQISGKTWKLIVANAKHRNISFNLSIQEIWKKFLQQNRKCAITNVQIGFEYKNITASLDRIDSSIGYQLNNIQWVHKKINELKWDFNLKELLYWSNLIVDPIIDDSPYLPIVSKNYQWVGYGDIPLRYWSGIVNKAKQRNIKFEISIEDAWNIFIKQNGKCALSGVALHFPALRKYEQTASLDRIDSLLPYSVNNIQWVHKNINHKLKKHMTEKELKYWCNKIIKGDLNENNKDKRTCPQK